MADDQAPDASAQGDPPGPAEEAPTPAQSVALIEHGGREFSRRIDRAGRFIFGLWGALWALSASTFYLALPDGPEWISRSAAIVVVSVATGVGFVVSTVLGVRASRAVRGPSRSAGAWYGWAWLLGFAAVAAMNVGLTSQGLPEDTVALLWSGTALISIGTLTLAAAASHRDRVGFGLGLWLLAGGVLSVLVGVPHNYLVLGIVGGSGMILYVAWPDRPRAVAPEVAAHRDHA